MKFLSTFSLEKRLPRLAILQILLLVVVGCRFGHREYSLEDQYAIAESRVEKMRYQLSFTFKMEKSSIYFGEPIPVTLRLSNDTDNPVVVRVPRQSDMLDDWAPKSVLIYSIVPVDSILQLRTPLLLLDTPYILGAPLLPVDFQNLDSHNVKEVNLEIPNLVYLKQGDKWIESKLPSGKYWVGIIYENTDIGYQIDGRDQIYYADISAWVGKLEAEPVLLTILP
ncbi:MAG: hypothetical protein JNM55_02690 [Anaerolineales bacterium]|nr:hypothetical protein [Anaerolineales bacterium]